MASVWTFPLRSAGCDRREVHFEAALLWSTGSAFRIAALEVWAAGCLMFLVTGRCCSEDLIFFGKPVPNHWSNPFRILNPRPIAKSKFTLCLLSTIHL